MDISQEIKTLKKSQLEYYADNFPSIEDSERFAISTWCFKSNPFPEIRKRYSELQRFYHTEAHLYELVALINFLKNKKLIDEKQASILYIIAFFHDAIYDPKSTTNEEDSAMLFLDFILDDLKIQACHYFISKDEVIKLKLNLIKENHSDFDSVLQIYQAILDTKTHKPKSEISKIFCALDLFCLTNYNLTELINYELEIFNEYQFYDYILYHEKRIQILTDFNKELKNPNLDALISYIKTRTVKIGLYPGSFNPFHIGHLDVLRKAEEIFDKVVICKGVNPAKVYEMDSPCSFKPYREIKNFNSYLVNFLNELNLKAREYEKQNNYLPIVEYYIVRGLRNHFDFDFEANQLRYSSGLAKQKRIKFNTVFLLSEPEFQHISSSDIRNMEKFEPGSAKHLIV